MARYIDADRLKEKKYYDEKRHEYCVSIAEVDWQPTADVQEVKHGKWVYEDYECSCCGESLSSIMDSDSYFSIGFNGCDYCPYCGAKMDKWSEADD